MHSPFLLHFFRLLFAQHSTYIMMSDSMDRKGTVGFRCVADVKGGTPEPPLPSMTSCPFQLCAEARRIETIESIDLSSIAGPEGDWAAYGYGGSSNDHSASAINRKLFVAKSDMQMGRIAIGTIGDVFGIPLAAANGLLDNTSPTISWSDGKPQIDVQGNKNYITLSGDGAGFTLSLPPASRDRMVDAKVYVVLESPATVGVEAVFKATLGGGSTATHALSLVSEQGQSKTNYEISVRYRSSDEWPTVLQYTLKNSPDSVAAVGLRGIAYSLGPKEP
jgi:hypothetical protein